MSVIKKPFVIHTSDGFGNKQQLHVLITEGGHYRYELTNIGGTSFAMSNMQLKCTLPVWPSNHPMVDLQAICEAIEEGVQRVEGYEVAPWIDDKKSDLGKTYHYWYHVEVDCQQYTGTFKIKETRRELLKQLAEDYALVEAYRDINDADISAEDVREAFYDEQVSFQLIALVRSDSPHMEVESP